jgi:hypothetical protein
MTTLLKFALSFFIYANLFPCLATENRDNILSESRSSYKRKLGEMIEPGNQQQNPLQEPNKKACIELKEELQKTEFEDMPQEVKLHILSFLAHPKDLCKFSQTNRNIRQISDYLYKLKMKEETPFFLNSTAPWLITYCFRITLLNFLREYQTRITAQQETLTLVKKMRPFSVFCKENNLPHDLLIESLWIQNVLYPNTVNWSDQFMDKFLKAIFYEDPIILELGLLLHSFSVTLLRQPGLQPHSFSCKKTSILSYTRDLISKGKVFLLHKLAKTYPESLLLDIYQGLGEGESNNEKILAERTYLLKLVTNKYSRMLQFNLGTCYEEGHGVKQDHDEAIKWFQFAAMQGYAPAQCKLGLWHYQDKYIKRDYYEAVKWFQLAAAQGHTTAQFLLGICYELGHGIKRDRDKAVQLYYLARVQESVNTESSNILFAQQNDLSK